MFAKIKERIKVEIIDILEKVWFNLPLCEFSKTREIAKFAYQLILGRKPQKICNFEQFDGFIEECNKLFQIDGERVHKFFRSYSIDFNSFYSLFGGNNPYTADPFSEDYLKWELSFFEFLAGKKYCFSNEGFPDQDLSHYHPWAGSTITEKIKMLQSQKDLLVELSDVSGKRLLEMGCGLGGLAVLFESCGYDYFAVDASKGFVEISKKRVYSEKIKSQIINKTFYDIAEFNQKFDLVIFEASFHHCNQPLKLLKLLYECTSINTKLVFLKEPFRYSYDRPWGVVRSDGETMFVIRHRGWLEFGFRLDFLYELFSKTGWVFKEVKTFLYEAQKVFIATKD